jgi:hypothetical protein
MAENISPSESYSFIMRVEVHNIVGMLGKVARRKPETYMEINID